MRTGTGIFEKLLKPSVWLGSSSSSLRRSESSRVMLQREEEEDMFKFQQQRWAQFIIKLKSATMIQERKHIGSFSQLLAAYSSSCTKLVSKHRIKMSSITSDGVRAMQDLFHSYQFSKKAILPCQQSQDASTMPLHPKPNKQGEEDTIAKPLNLYEFSVVKSKRTSHDESRVLSEKLDKLNLGSDYLLMDDDEMNDSAKLPPKHGDDIKRMTIVEMIQASNRKLKETQDTAQDTAQQEEESEYEITDYSSNESSNEGDYQAHYGEESENKPLFPGLFSKSFDSYSSQGSLFPTNKFSAKELLKSPKKQPKNKRLFVGNKKVPRWAEDLEEVVRKQDEQKGLESFGCCVVENLDTNLVFEKELELERTSSARWNPRMFLE